jgi:hypothetical protein
MQVGKFGGGSMTVRGKSWVLKYYVRNSKDEKKVRKCVAFARTTLPADKAMKIAERMMRPINAHWRNKSRGEKMIEKAKRKIKRLSWDDRIKMLEAQGGRCAVCRTGDPGKNGWHYDHDHETGAWRGVLCLHCNVGLGYFRDNVETMQAMIDYVLHHKGGQALLPIAA